MATINKIRTEAKIELTESDDESDVYEIYDDIGTLVITVSFPDGSGSAKIQATTSIHEDIEADDAVWVDWSNGLVSDTTQDSCIAPNAIKVINNAVAAVRVDVRGNYGSK